MIRDSKAAREAPRITTARSASVCANRGRPPPDVRRCSMAAQQEPYPGGARYDVRDQYGRIINNAEQQYNYSQHVQYVQQARESFLRDVAATRTKARILVWVGLLLFVAGGAVYTAVLLRFIERAPSFGLDTSPADIQL